MALITPNFRDLGFFPDNPMSKSEPHANQGKESTATASSQGQACLMILLKNPHFLFLIDAKNAFDSNTKVAIDKFWLTLILTREK